jgi:hypothetical protein
VCVRSVCGATCVGGGLAADWALDRRVPPTMHRINELKKGSKPREGM